MTTKLVFYLVFLQILTYSFAADTSGIEKCTPTIEMIDASGKLPSGIMAGNLVELGSFDECIAIETDVTRGKYCMLRISSPLLNPSTAAENSETFSSNNKASDIQERIMLNDDPTSNALILGICVPEECNVQLMRYNISQEILNTTITANIIPVHGTGYCQTKDDVEPELNGGDWTVVGFIIAVLVVMVLSTLYDVYLDYQKKAPAHLILVAFSVKTNGKKLLSTSKNADQLLCLNGVRVLSMMWVILGHRYIVTFMSPVSNMLDMQSWMDNVGNMYILNAPVSVDSFLVLSGLLVTYVFLLATDKGVKFNIILYYVHRYLRLTPVLAVIVLIHATILMYVGSGPNWPFVTVILKDPCVEKWWTTLLYVQNYVHETVCIGQTWYLAVDFQLFLLSPLLLIPLRRWPKITIQAAILLVLISMAGGMYVSWYYDMPGFTIDFSNEHFMPDYYYATHIRYGPWLMGFILGYIIYYLKKNRDAKPFTMSPLVVLLGWLCSLAVMAASLFAAHSLVSDHERVSLAFFNGMHRHGWSLGLCWVIFACVQGYGGFINTFLSWSVFQVLGRFTYTMYLIHLSAMYMMAGSLRTNVFFNDFNTYFLFCGDVLLSLALAVCFTLAFESPMLTVEKILFGAGKKPRKTELPIHSRTNGEAGHTNNGFVKE